MTLPFIEIKEDISDCIREFSQSIDPIALKWHRDAEDREIVALYQTDWKIQLENKLPQDLSSPVFIIKGEWHRLIKGTGNLIIKIKKKK